MERHGHLGGSFLGRTPRTRLLRYAVTSIVATITSECVLVTLYSLSLLTALTASLAAAAAGSLPAYVMSRYWIWPEGDRRRPARQASLYWSVSLVAVVVASAITDGTVHLAPKGLLAHDIWIATAYLGSYGLLWLLRFVVYQRVVFAPAVPGPQGPVPDLPLGPVAEGSDFPPERQQLPVSEHPTATNGPTC